MIFRNTCPAFDGECICESEGDKLFITRRSEEAEAVLKADLSTYQFEIEVK